MVEQLKEHIQKLVENLCPSEDEMKDGRKILDQIIRVLHQSEVNEIPRGSKVSHREISLEKINKLHSNSLCVVLAEGF